MTQALTTQAAERGNVNRQLAIQHSSVKKSDFYSVGGKTLPGARAIQKFANTQNISSEVIRLEWLNESSFYTAACTAYVRAWIGPRAKPKQETTQAITLSMVSIIQRYVTKKLTAKNYAWPESDVVIGDDGRILPATKKRQLEMLSYLADQRTFLDRSAITKAESRAFDKLLRPDAVEEYDDDHEQPAAHVDVDTGEVTEGPPPPRPPVPHAPEPEDDPVGPEAEDPEPPPREAKAPTVEPSFPPTAEEMASHNKQVENLGKEKPKKEPPPPPTLGAEARELIEKIEKAGAYRSGLEKLGTTLTKAKADLPAGEYAQVMQVFWKAHATAK